MSVLNVENISLTQIFKNITADLFAKIAMMMQPKKQKKFVD